MTDLSIVIISYNTRHLLERCINKIETASKKIKSEIIVVDNNSEDNSVEWLNSNQDRLKIIKNKTNVGFGRAVNQAIKKSCGKYILLVNTDAFLTKDSIEKTIEFMCRNPQCGIAGATVFSEDGQKQPSARNFITPTNLFLTRAGLIKAFPKLAIDRKQKEEKSPISCDWVTGCYFMIRRSLLNDIGFFDEKFFLYCEELDLCKRAKDHDWQVFSLPNVKITHIGGESSKEKTKQTDQPKQISELQIESEIIYFRKHHGYFGAILHLLLTISGDIFLLAWASIRRKSYLKIITSHLTTTIEKSIRTRLGAMPTR